MYFKPERANLPSEELIKQSAGFSFLSAELANIKDWIMAKSSGGKAGLSPGHALGVHSWANYLKPWDLHLNNRVGSCIALFVEIK